MRTAIVTGASRGIGRSVSLRLAKEGFEVALLARNEDDLNRVKQEIEHAGGSAISMVCDVTESDNVNSVVSSLRLRWQKVDILFNNAAQNVAGTIEVQPEDFKRLFEVNILGVYHVLRATVPWFKEVGSGTIIQLASVAGITGFAGAGAYCATKFALRGLSESLHHELEPLGIRVTAISPSWVNTKMAAHCPHPMDKIIQPEDIAEAVMYVHRLPPSIALKELVLGCRQDLE